MTVEHNSSGPHPISLRIPALDVLRGFAILGILVMNIQSFSMPEAAYLNPSAYGDLTGLNKCVWIVSHVVADQKFMTIFSLLFGAGIVLLTQRAEAKGRRSASVHYRRTLWLWIIGMMHAYLLWHGDILVPYSLCAVLVYLFRKLSPRKLLVIGGIVFLVPSILYVLFGLSIPQWPSEAVADTKGYWEPSQEAVSRELTAYRGSWLTQMKHRVPSSVAFQTFVFFIWFGWRIGSLMLFGMALFKLGILSAERSQRFYRRMAVIGLGVGLPVVVYGIIRNFRADWAFEYSMFLGWQFNYWGSLPIGLGYIALIMLMCQSRRYERLKSLFAPIGRTALSNYLGQTIICTTLFYGHGLGVFGHVQRWQQVIIMFGVWVIQLAVTPLWLRYFKFGPAEWVWRSLTYWRVQPMRIGSDQSAIGSR